MYGEEQLLSKLKSAENGAAVATATGGIITCTSMMGGCVCESSLLVWWKEGVSVGM
jgi:hypothetical protein